MTGNDPQVQYPLITSNLDDLLTPGVMVEVDPEVADAYGAFEELALSEDDAWASNLDSRVEGDPP